MRIFECSDSFLPIVDGVGRVVTTYSRMLAERGHEVYVICPMSDTGYRGNLPYEIVDFSSTVSMRRVPQYKAGVAGLDPHYMKRIEQITPDIIHVHSPGTAGFEGVRLAKKYGVPLIGTFHSKFYDDMYNMTGSRAIARVGASAIGEFFNGCDETWTVSRFAAKELESYGFRNAVRIVHNGTNARFSEPTPAAEVAEKLSLNKDPVLLFVGQIDRKKNIPLILEACALVKEKGKRFQMIFAGQGRDMERFREKAEQLGIGDVVCFTGHIADEHLLAGLYKCAMLFLFPSLYDTAGLVVTEAASMGTPSLVVRSSAPAEFVTNGETGLICEENADSLAAAVCRALDDPERIARMGEQAQIRMPRPWETVIDEVEKLYDQIADERRAVGSRGFRRITDRVLDMVGDVKQ